MSDVATSLAPVRRLARRLTASFLAVALFVATGGATLAGQACAHHDGVPAAAAQAPSEHGAGHDAQAHAGHGARAEHDTHGGHNAAADDPSSGHAHDDSGACTCVGACQGATTIPAAVEPAVVVAATLSTQVVAPELRLELLPRAWQAAWFLPPGNGPPTLV